MAFERLITGKSGNDIKRALEIVNILIKGVGVCP
jgi:hypothetical protein